MEMHVDYQNRLVEIWLSNTEAGAAALGPFCEKYRNTPYRVVVFRSGGEDLIENTAALLRYNR